MLEIMFEKLETLEENVATKECISNLLTIILFYVVSKTNISVRDAQLIAQICDFTRAQYGGLFMRRGKRTCRSYYVTFAVLELKAVKMKS